MPGLPEVRQFLQLNKGWQCQRVVLWKGKTLEHLSWPAHQEVATAFVTYHGNCKEKEGEFSNTIRLMESPNSLPPPT